MAQGLQLQDMSRALALMTRLPVRADDTRRAEAAWAWPLAGAIAAVIAGTVGAFLGRLGLPAELVAGVALGAMIVLTGAMHEDGLADSADGLWGGFTRERRLEIMKDSRIGTYGVLALVLSLMLRWAALTALIPSAGLIGTLIGVAALSRAPMAAIMSKLPNARGEGLSAGYGRIAPYTALTGCLAAIAVALVTLGLGPTIAAAFAAAIAGFAVAAIADAKIGGQTGDILGASQQLAEIAALAALTLFV